jgi:hypothetical protein
MYLRPRKRAHQGTEKNIFRFGQIMTHRACRGYRRLWIVVGMKHVRPPKPPSDWIKQQLQGSAQAPPSWSEERRHRADRRDRGWMAVWYGSFNPRRRNPPRRLDDSRHHLLDWYSADLLAVAIGILLLSAADAFLTGVLLVNGADEVNPLMAALVYRSVAAFTALKMAMTGAGVVLLVFLSRYRFMRLFRVEWILLAVLGVYLWLIGYEIWMLKNSVGPMFL